MSAPTDTSNVHAARVGADDDTHSEYGAMYSDPAAHPRSAGNYADTSRFFPGGKAPPLDRGGLFGGDTHVEGLVRDAGSVAVGFGRGPLLRDSRKYRYDTARARTMKPVAWSASKVDRMDAQQAGDALNAIHEMFGIAKESEDRLKAFDDALWYQHTVNGASQLQVSRGEIIVDGQAFDLSLIVEKLGTDLRRFFRAYADDIAANNQAILADYDPYDADSVEKVGAIRSVAVARGLDKYPYLAHDSSDACVRISGEERRAVLAAKRYYLPMTVNSVDSFVPVGDEVSARGAQK